MRILFTTNPLPTHFRPMLPLIRAAAAAGHEVVVATGPDLAPEIQRRGYQCWSVGPAAADAWVELTAAAPPASPEEQFRRAVSVLFGRTSVARARDLLPLAARWAPDVVVHEPAEAAGAEVAALLGVREIVHGPTSDADRVASMMPLITAELAAALRVPDRVAEVAAAPYLDPRPPSFLPRRLGQFSDIRPVRPELEPSTTTKLPLRAQRWASQRTVLLTLGTGSPRPEHLAAALTGIASMAVNVFVETGPRLDVGSLGPAPHNVAIGRTLPYDQILPTCSAVVSHGASELVIGALSHGLPHVSLPRGADQTSNAHQLTRSGAGITVPDPLNPGSVRRALADVLAETRFPRAALQLQAELASLPTAAAVVAGLSTPVAA